MKMTRLTLEGALLLEPAVYRDSRGFFMESYKEVLLQEAGISTSFIQDNQSYSAEPHVLRGLHYQANPKAQTKLLRVVSGAIYDVIVDLRRNSPTFGRWESVILSEYNHRQILIPKGFAHGFCTLVPDTRILYKVDEYYAPESDRGILWNDPALGIDWPTSEPILSEKDRQHPRFREADLDFE